MKNNKQGEEIEGERKRERASESSVCRLLHRTNVTHNTNRRAYRTNAPYSHRAERLGRSMCYQEGGQTVTLAGRHSGGLREHGRVCVFARIAHSFLLAMRLCSTTSNERKEEASEKNENSGKHELLVVVVEHNEHHHEMCDPLARHTNTQTMP